jgi:hypothetical protein
MIASSALMGALAGFIGTTSALPMLSARAKGLLAGKSRFSGPDLLRDCLQALANGLWVCVGLENHLYPTAFFCGLNAAFLFAMAVLNLRSRRRSH